jgi:hypothetical protein
MPQAWKLYIPTYTIGCCNVAHLELTHLLLLLLLVPPC